MKKKKQFSWKLCKIELGYENITGQFPLCIGEVRDIVIKGSLLPKKSFLSRSVAAKTNSTISLLEVTSSVTTKHFPAPVREDQKFKV